MKIGIAGYGRMGAAMAARIAEQGHDVAVWSRSAGSTEKARTQGFPVADSLSQLVAASEVILSSLFDDAAVREVYLGAGGLVDNRLDGRLLIDTSTVAPAVANALADAVAGAGGRFVDAPVLGTVQPARQGALTCLLGGLPQDMADARAVMGLVSSQVYPMGPVGAGYAGKLAITLLKATYWTALGDCMTLAGRFAITPSAILDVLEGGSGALVELSAKLPVLRGQTDAVGFSIEGVLKDLSLMIAAGGGAEHMPVTTGARQAVERAISGGWGARDVAAVALFPAR